MSLYELLLEIVDQIRIAAKKREAGTYSNKTYFQGKQIACTEFTQQIKLLQEDFDNLQK